MGRMVMDEGELMKCRKHPSKQRTSGVCPFCLRDRLIRLCPDCANVRPCACCPTTTTTSCSSSSSSTTTTSLFLSSPKAKTKTKTTTSVGDVGAIGRISNLIDNEPAFQRSRSTAFHFLRHKDVTSRLLPPLGDRTKSSSSSSSSFWSSVFKKSKNVDETKHQEEEEKQVKMRRSKSVSGGDSDPSQIPVTNVRLKGRSWYFPSPIKAFRQNKTSRTLQERSPLCRG